MSKPITWKMARALEIAHENHQGCVFAGANMTKRGAGERVNPSVIRALATRGLVTLATHADGGIMGRLTDKGRQARIDAYPVRS